MLPNVQYFSSESGVLVIEEVCHEVPGVILVCLASICLLVNQESADQPPRFLNILHLELFIFFFATLLMLKCVENLKS